MKKKRLLSMLLAVAMMVTFMPLMAYASDYAIPANVKELDFSDVYSTGWYQCQETGEEMYLPCYKFTVSAGAKDWVKFKVSTCNLYLDYWYQTVKLHLIRSDGEEVDVSDWDSFVYYEVTAGETYYLYIDNSGNDTPADIYIGDSYDYICETGTLDNLEYQKTKTNTTNPVTETTGWDVYTVGYLSESRAWNVAYQNVYGWFYYWVSLDVISAVPVYFYNPCLNANFGTNQSIYKNAELSDEEDEMVLSAGENHYKVNYLFNIADHSYKTDRTSMFQMDVYVPAGYVLYEGEDGFLHTKVGSGDDSDDPVHTHILTKVDAKTATCIAEGNSEYWTCSCGKYFSDAAGTNEISIENVVIPKTSHTIVSVPEKAATATENGYKAHYKCSVCGKLFSDAEGTNEISSPEVISATGSQTNTSAAQTAAEPAPTLAVTAKISKPKAAKGAVTVKWKKASKKVQKKISGYQIQVATDASFTNVVKTVKAGKKASSKKIKLAKKTQYYVRIRAIKGSAFGAWSAVKAVKTK